METNPYQSPDSAQIELNNLSSQLASRWARLAASLIDTLLLMVTFLPLSFAVFSLYHAGSFEDFFLSTETFTGSVLIDEAIFTVLYFTLYLLFNGYLLLNYGQTIGKKLLKIAIVDYQTGELTSFARVFGIRFVPVTLVVSIPVIGGFLSIINVLTIFGNDKRCVHDHLAGTKVVLVNKKE